MGAIPEPAAKRSRSRPSACAMGKPFPKGALVSIRAPGAAARMISSAILPPRFTSRSALPSGEGALASAK